MHHFQIAWWVYESGQITQIFRHGVHCNPYKGPKPCTSQRHNGAKLTRRSISPRFITAPSRHGLSWTERARWKVSISWVLRSSGTMRYKLTWWRDVKLDLWGHDWGMRTERSYFSSSLENLRDFMVRSTSTNMPVHLFGTWWYQSKLRSVCLN